MRAYVLRGKGPPLIMGFTFLEDNRFLVDCTSRTLTPKDGGRQVKCLQVQTAAPDPAIHPAEVTSSCCPTQSPPTDLVVQRFPIQHYLPPLPAKKFAGDAAYDFFAPTEIRLHPGER